MTIKKTLLIIALGSLSLLSFNKKVDSEQVETPTKTALLINKKWKMINVTASYNGGVPVDAYSSLDECGKDDLFQYSAISNTVKKGTFNYLVNTKCDPSEVNEKGTWVLNAAETEIKISVGGVFKETFNIIELSADTFKISKSNGNGNSIVKANVTFARQK